MGRSRKRHGTAFWQSAWMNDQAYLTYRLWILILCINRFKWHGLPETCDPRYLEETLALYGVATISTPRGGSVWTSTRAITSGPTTLYDTPRSWRSFGANGFGYEVDRRNGVLVYNSQIRRLYPDGWIDMYARRLADLDRAKDLNIQQQKRPWLITAPQEKVADLVNVYKQASGGEPAILGIKGLVSDVEVQTFGTQVPFLLTELDDASRRLWNDVYSFIGVENLTQKAERRIEDEVNREAMPTSIMAMDALNARNAAAEQFNKISGYEAYCTWDYDNATKLYQAKVLEPVLPILEEEGELHNAGI